MVLAEHKACKNLNMQSYLDSQPAYLNQFVDILTNVPLEICQNLLDANTNPRVPDRCQRT